MTSVPNNTVVYETYDGELFSSKEAVQEYCRDKPYRLGMMGWTEKTLRIRSLGSAGVGSATASKDD